MIDSVRETFLPLAIPSLGDEEINEVVDSLRSGWLTTGPKTQRFEELCREYLGCEHVVALSSCSGALHAALLALDIGAGDEVITTPVTWPATSNVIWHVGARPVFVDIEDDTLNMDVELLEAAVTSKTKAIMPVHMAGQPCDMNPMREIADRYGVPIIEDAAHAIGARYQDSLIGSDGSHACFSFYATKNMTTGEGGMFVTSDEKIAARVRRVSQHGVSRDAWNRESGAGLHWNLVEPGLKFNLSDVLASIGLHQIRKLDQFIHQRRLLAQRYDVLLSKVAGVTPLAAREDRSSAHHLYIVQLDVDALGVTRDDMMIGLRERNIGCGVHFVSTHLQPYYQKTLGMRPDDLPVAAKISETILSLPLSPNMSMSDVDDVVAAMTDVVQRAN